MFQLNEDEMLILNTVKKLTHERITPLAAIMDKTDEFSWDLVKIFTENGLLSPSVPQRFGGPEISYLLFSIILEEISKVSAAAALLLIAQADGMAPILIGGSEEQKERYMPGFVKGKLACFAATEPDAGSDIQAMKTRAVRKGKGYVINGQKCFITNGSVADVMTLFVYTDPAKKSKGISAFIVEKGAEGLVYGKNEDKMGMRGSVNSQLFFEDLYIDEKNRIGEEGEGLRILMKAIEMARFQTASQAVGLAQGAIDEAVKYTKQRVQFGRPIADLQAIQFMIADMVATTEASRLLTRQAASNLDNGRINDIPLSCSIAKFMASDNAMKVTTDALQIFGGYGYMKDYPMERMMRDAKIIQIYTGTNQIMRLVAAREIFK